LDGYKIKFILNVALLACENYFIDNSNFTYKSFNLYDAGHQPVTALFISGIDFIENARKNGKGVKKYIYF
jgi:hypothetical protein